MTVYLVRHAVAGDRSRWSGHDRLRPLSGVGRHQAADLVDALAQLVCDAPVPAAGLGVVMSSPYRRCLETVAPLAAAIGVTVVTTEALAEGADDEAIGLVRSVAYADIVLCSHGDVIPAVLDHVRRHDGVDLGPAPRCQKASVWMLHPFTPRAGATDGTIGFASATYLAPPARGR